MNYRYRELSFPSADEKHTLHAEIYEPVDRPVRGVVQVVHGMVDHIGRYKNLAAALTEAGYVMAGNSHLGHGKSAATPEDLGFFAEKDGVKLVLKDLHTMNRTLRAMYPEQPIVIFGHSMGSFLARLYVEKYPNGINGLVIHGTGGRNPAVPIAKALAAVVRTLRGPRYRSNLIYRLAFGAYNKKFDKSEGHSAWLTRDQAQLLPYKDDPLVQFRFTIAAYADLFSMLGDSNSKAWFAAYPKNLPTLILSGDMDPVGAYGKGPAFVYKHLLLAGCDRVQLKLYPGARHELFHETNKEEVFADLLQWLKTIPL